MGDANLPSALQASAKANFNSALDYIYEVQNRFNPDHPEIYKQFLDILMEYHKAPRDIDGVHSRIKSLFAAEPELLEGFGKFLPEVTPKENNAGDGKEGQKDDNERLEGFVDISKLA